MSPTFHRALLALLPALLLVAVAVAAIWGENGVFARFQLQRDLARETDELAALDRENAQLLRDIQQLGDDPLLVERAVAEEIGWARPGTTIYRFDPSTPTP